MAENGIHSLTSTLGSQGLSMGDPPSIQVTQTGDPMAHLSPPHQHQQQPPAQQQQSAPGDPNVNPETPVKRRPGRPKGSGKKPVDVNAEPKMKRPVGRPRKDGLPAGSVGPKRPPRPRKRPPGTFAAGSQQPPNVYPYGVAYDPSQAWQQSISAPPMSRSQFSFPIDPSLDRDNWAELLRHRPDVFLHALVAALASPNPLSAAGPSVEEAFRQHLASLAPTNKTANAPAIPSLYSILKTFWLPSSPAYFSLTASASTSRTPPEHRFLYWDPQPLVFNGLACPACSAPLINNGRISSGPIKVYDLGKPFFIIGCEYVCRSPVCLPPGSNTEGRKFASTDASIFRALPGKLKDEFPARLLGAGPAPDMGTGPEVWNWRGMGVSIALWNMVKACLRTGMGKEGILGVIRGIVEGVPEEEPWMMAGPSGSVPKQENVVPQAQEEEEEEEEGEGDVGGSGAGGAVIGAGDDREEEEVEGNLHPAKDKEPEQYQEVWNANRGGDEPSSSASAVHEQHAGPSDANGHAPPPSQAVNPSHTVVVNSQHEQNNQQHQHEHHPHPYAFAQAQPPYMPYPYAPYAYYPPPQHHAAGSVPPPPAGTLKRTFTLVDHSGDPAMAEPMQKRIRHCVKCGSNECKGKGGRAFCTNPCQDCGKNECKGRNSKRPDRTCADAWP